MSRCLLACEGPFDKLIYDLLKGIFDENKLEIIPMEGTFLDDPSFSKDPNSLMKKVLDKERTYSIDDFDEIVYLFDTDGMFLDDECVILDSTTKRTQYSLNEIRCSDPKNIKVRNKNRRKNVSDILKVGTTFIYYNSRNLEHAFDPKNIKPMTNSQKSAFALRIATRYSGDLQSFIKHIRDMNKSGTDDYAGTWDYVKRGENSLSSCSNLYLFLKKNYDSIKEEYKHLLLD